MHIALLIWKFEGAVYAIPFFKVKYFKLISLNLQTACPLIK